MELNEQLCDRLRRQAQRYERAQAARRRGIVIGACIIVAAVLAVITAIVLWGV